MLPRPKISRRRLLAGAGTASASAVLLGPHPASASARPAGEVVAIFPVRVYDSRTDTSILDRRKFRDGDAVSINVAAAYEASPSGYASAIFGNVTITETEGSGYLTIQGADYSGEGPTAVHSNINWWQSGITMANSFLSQVGAEHSIVVSCRGGRTHVVVDVFGYVPIAV